MVDVVWWVFYGGCCVMGLYGGCCLGIVGTVSLPLSNVTKPCLIGVVWWVLCTG